MVLKDINQEERKNNLSIIEELLTYPEESFTINIDSQQVIIEVMKAYNAIEEGLKNGYEEIILQDVLCAGGIADEYSRILTDYLREHGKTRKTRCFNR